MKDQIRKIVEPKILNADYRSLTPCSTFDARRASEEEKQSEVASFFERIGLDVERDWEYVRGHGLHFGDEIYVVFMYRESSDSVSTYLEVYKNGQLLNINALRKMYQ